MFTLLTKLALKTFNFCQVAFTLKLTQNSIIVLNNRFKSSGGSICVVPCLQELEQQSVWSYVYTHFSVAHALHDVSLLSCIESG